MGYERYGFDREYEQQKYDVEVRGHKGLAKVKI